MHAVGLIIIGDEILSGSRRDQHLGQFIKLLDQRRLKLAWAEYIGDEPERITVTLRRALDGGDMVVSTGGIGATPDDHTRACAARALGVPLIMHPQARALILERMRAVAGKNGEAWEPDRADNVQRQQMAVFPEGAALVPNPYNQIAGFSCAGKAGGRVYFVPGFPQMAWPMMAWALDQELASGHLLPEDWQERSVIIHGTGEALLTPVMQRVEAAHPAAHVFSLPSVSHPEYGPHIDLGVKGAPEVVDAAFADLLEWVQPLGLPMGPQLHRP